MKKSSLRLLVLVVAALTSTLVAACDDELIDDATFRLWCLESLCSWKLDTGRVQPAPTWHVDDYGVELVDTPTVISQDLKKSAACLVFTSVADVEESARVTMGIDFTGDGIADYEQPIVATGFREVTTEVRAPRTNSVPRIFISKRGSGRAVLAQIRLRAGDKCSAPPLVLQNRGLGDACTLGVGGECTSGVCCEGVCAECCLGPEDPNASKLYVGIGQDGNAVVSPAVACPGDGICERRPVEQLAYLVTVVPFQCSPGRQLRGPGAVCLADDDCTSSICDGASSTALQPVDPTRDSGACPNADFPDGGAEGCVFTRVREGRCR
jgi:hypothetical protein